MKVGIIGAGVIGKTVAINFLKCGIDVVLIDVQKQPLFDAFADIKQHLRIFSLLEDSKQQGKLTISLEYESLRNCDYLIENVTESKEVKKEVYNKLSFLITSNTIVCVNTSCIQIREIASNMPVKENIVGVHFMNPAYAKEYVEVIPSEYTSTYCKKMLNRLLKRLNKKALYSPDIPGFISNRISHVFFNEAAALLGETNIKPEEIDLIFKNCFNHDMGPLETADLIGLDTVKNTLDLLYDYYCDKKYICCQTIIDLVEKGELGRKSGKGFYNYVR